jgi:hypothetical protein
MRGLVVGEEGSQSRRLNAWEPNERGFAYITNNWGKCTVLMKQLQDGKAKVHGSGMVVGEVEIRK